MFGLINLSEMTCEQYGLDSIQVSNSTDIIEFFSTTKKIRSKTIVFLLWRYSLKKITKTNSWWIEYDCF